MGYFNYEIAKEQFKNNEFVLETIKRLQDFDEFHCLRDTVPHSLKSVSTILSNVPDEYFEWLSVCNGGMLFDTTLLSVDAHDPQIGLDFSTLAEYNTSSNKQGCILPDGYSIIALRSDGAPICVIDNWRLPISSHIYLFDEKGSITDIWNTFYDFLAEEVDTALELIANKDLEPIPLKILNNL